MSLTKVSYSMINGAPVNILDYGADPTGLSDSTAAIQAAIDYAQSVSNEQGGATVYLPQGKYQISETLTVLHPISLIGDGSTSTSLIATAGLTGPCIQWGVEGTVPRPGYAVVIEKLGLYGDDTVSSSAHGIQMWASHTDIKDCIIRGFRGTGIYLLDSWSNVIDHCWLYGNRSMGIHLGKASNIVVVQNSYILGSGNHGIYVTAGNKIVIQGNDIEANQKSGIYIDGDGSTAIRSLSILNNYFEVNNASAGGYANVYASYGTSEISYMNISYNYFEDTVNSAIETRYLNPGCVIENNLTTGGVIWKPLDFGSSSLMSINNPPSTTNSLSNAVYSPGIYWDTSEGVVINGRLSRFAVNTQEGTVKGTLWSVSGRYSITPFPTFTVGSRTEYPGTAAPGSGTYSTGDIVYNTAPSAGGYMGWVCVSGGSPGTWKGFGAIQA